MDIFSILKKIDFDPNTLDGLNDLIIIKLENDLKAQAIIEPEIGPDSVENTLKLLRNYPEELKFFYSNPPLIKIIGSLTGRVKSIRYINDFVKDDERIKFVLSNFFYNDLITYIDLAFINGSNDMVRSLFNYTTILPQRILEHIYSKFETKIKTALDGISKNPPNEESMDILKSISLYQLASELASLNIDNLISKILNRLIELRDAGNIPSDSTHFAAMNHYNAVSDQLNQILSNNKPKTISQAQIIQESNSNVKIFIMVIILISIFVRACHGLSR